MLALGIAVLLAPLPLRADTEPPQPRLNEVIESTRGDLRNTQRKLGRVETRQRELERRQRDLQEMRRMGHPFHSERSLRHDIERNDQRNRWETREQRRLQFESQRQSRELQRLQRLRQRN